MEKRNSNRVQQDSAHSSPLGFDAVTFLVSTNPGQPLQPIAKVASGGELSRMSLAIQVITAQKVDTPSLILMKLTWVFQGQQQP